MTPTIGSLFSGSGMLDEGVRDVIGGTVAWHAEYEPPTEKNPNPTQAGARVLAHRYPGVPNLGDISTVDWSTVPPVDIITGGFPCQDVSHAGRRAGLKNGTRSGLWARMCDAIETIRPAYALIENVRGLSSACADSEMGRCPRCVGGAGPHRPVLRAIGRVLGDLADVGYDAQWVGLPASDIGAPHERFRYFILAADTRSVGRVGWRSEPGLTHWSSAEAERRGLGVVADADDRTRHGEWSRTESDGGGAAAADAERGRRDGWTPDEIRRQVERTAAARAGEDTAANTDRDAVREQPVTEQRRGGATVAGLDRETAAHRPIADGTQLTDALRAAEAATHTDSDGRALLGRQLHIQRHTHRRDSADIAWGDYEPAIRRWEHLTRPAPAPTETGPRGGERLSRWFDEWMMGWPDGWVTDVPGITYREAIKLCGNGVVRQQAAHATRRLFAMAERAA